MKDRSVGRCGRSCLVGFGEFYFSLLFKEMAGTAGLSRPVASAQLGVAAPEVSRLHSGFCVIHGLINQSINQCDVGGALESARESVRIYNKHGIDDATSQKAVDLLRKLEGGA